MAETSKRYFDPFRVLTHQECESHLNGYLRFMHENDGSCDIDQRRLSLREMYFEELRSKPIRSLAPVDHEAFAENFDVVGDAQLDRKTAWLVVAAKANTGEAYGVERELLRIERTGAAPETDELYLRMLLQESYHSKILIEVCRAAGVEVSTPLPHWNQRLLVQIIMRLPDKLRWILVICAEVVGCAIFRVLIENCDLFAEEPEVEERIRSLLGEILRDEVLHVAFLRARLSPRGLASARKLAPFVARAALLDLPQLAALGATRQQLLAQVHADVEMPDGISWMAADPETAALAR